MSQRSLPSARGPRTLIMGAVVFVAGAVLMATEVLAFRVIGRTFGTALRETSAVIAVFLAAMSLGYALGGAIGDRRPHYRTLVVPLAASGTWIVLVPFVDRALSDAVATSALPLSWHAIVVTLALFAPPAGLLAAVSPIVIRLSTRVLESTGRVAGSVAALSAVGSIAGTLATGFYFIGHQPIPTIMRGLGLTLIVTAAVVLLMRTRRTAPSVLAAAGLLLALPCDARVIYEHDSAYHNIRVVDRGAFRHLLFDDTRQSRMLIDDPTQGGYAYTRFFHMTWLFNDALETVLFLGLGGATGPREYLADYPKVHVEVVEVDPAVIRVAREYFALPEDDERLSVEAIDARVALRRREGLVDAIIVDAYTSGRYGSMLPFHLTTHEFFDLAASRLTEDGVLLYNVVQKMDSFEDDFLRALIKTLRTTFAEVYLFEPTESNNTVVAAVRRRLELDVEAISLRAQQLVNSGFITRPDYVDDAIALYDGEIPTDDVPLLTDDYAPVARLLGR